MASCRHLDQAEGEDHLAQAPIQAEDTLHLLPVRHLKRVGRDLPLQGSGADLRPKVHGATRHTRREGRRARWE